MSNMRTNEILSYLMDNGGFHNWRKWTSKECSNYVREAFPCTRYVANKVGKIIKNW